MRIKKAVITAAGRNQRSLPLQTLVDRGGQQKSALQIIIEEAVSAGVEDVCIVIAPGDEKPYAAAAGEQAGRLRFVQQTEPRGYGHALHAAQSFAGDDPFLHLVSDHLYISHAPVGCARQLVDAAEKEQCAVSAVQPTRESMLAWYGTVGGRRVPKQKHLYEVENVVEKPTPTEAEQTLIVPGLRAGHYLCFFGMHVLTPAVMEILGQLIGAANGQGVQLSAALARLPGRERYLALEVAGLRYNIGVKYGLLIAQLALALDGQDRQQILTEIVELMAMRDQVRGQ